MPGINLVIDQYIKKQALSTGTISLTKSSAPHIYQIPFQMRDYSPLIAYCSVLVPLEWQTQIQALIQAERDLILQRQTLLASYKATLAEQLPQLVAQFKEDHPEHFI